MGKLLCETNLRDVWCRNESVRAEIGQILQTHRQTHASKLVVEMSATVTQETDRFHFNPAQLFTLHRTVSQRDMTHDTRGGGVIPGSHDDK